MLCNQSTHRVVDAFEYVSIDLTEKNLDFADTAKEVFDKVSPYKVRLEVMCF